MLNSDEITNFIKNTSKKGFFNLLSANILIQIVAFASQLFVAGILSPDDIGRIKILQTFLALFTIAGSMGFNSSTLKLCSEDRSESEIRSIFRSGVVFTLITTVAVYGIVLLLNQLNLLTQDKAIQTLIPLALFPLVSNSFFSLYVSYHQARNRVKLIANLTSINKILSVVLIVILTYYFGIKGYYFAFNIALIALLIAGILITKKYNRDASDSTLLSKDNFNLHWKYAKPSFYSRIFTDLGSYVDILLINFLIQDINEIGYYSFALTMTVVFRLFPATVQQITIPYFSKLTADSDKFILIYKRYSKLLLSVIALTCVAALIVIPFFIDLIYKGKYNASIPYFIPLAIGWSILQYNQIQAAALFGIGKVSEIAKSQFIMFIINAIIIFFAIQIWGLMGAAYASILCSTINVLILRYYFNRSVNFSEE